MKKQIKMNIEPVELSKHTPGIDIAGIRIVDNQIKFVICEVKLQKRTIFLVFCYFIATGYSKIN